MRSAPEYAQLKAGTNSKPIIHNSGRAVGQNLEAFSFIYPSTGKRSYKVYRRISVSADAVSPTVARLADD
jgi:hypothetical protein